MQTFHVLITVQKPKNAKKRPKNSFKKIKNDGHFRIPHPQISLKQFLNICENVVYFYNFFILNGQFIFFYILQLPHTVISNSEKLTHPITYGMLKLRAANRF